MTEVSEIRLKSLEESNLFLRALWAQMRARFGRLGWQYTPHRFGPQQTIRLGWATLGAASPNGVEIRVHYKARGVIDAISFIPRGAIADQHPHLDAELTASVKEALISMRSPSQSELSSTARTSPSLPMALFFSERWHIGPLSDGQIEIGLVVNSFDSADREYEFLLRRQMLLDALSVWTNCVWAPCPPSDESKSLDLRSNLFFEDHEWLEDHPVDRGMLRLSPDQLRYGDIIVAGMLKQADRLPRAARLFREALALSAAYDDIATALLMSALEVVSLKDIEPQNCSECGQPVYKISRRVAERGVRHLGPGAKWVFDDHYQRRSKYLHIGASYALQPLTGNSIPQLDPDGIEGCAMPNVVGTPRTLIEFTSFIIRAEMREYVNAKGPSGSA